MQGRHTVMMLEPGTQCAVYTEGVDPDAFLEAVQALMLRAEAMPVGCGRASRRVPHRRAGPFGTLTYLRARYTSILPPAGKPPPIGPDTAAGREHPRLGAANRTDGRPNTAVITTDIEVPPR